MYKHGAGPSLGFGIANARLVQPESKGARAAGLGQYSNDGGILQACGPGLDWGCGPEGCRFEILPRVLKPTLRRVGLSLQQQGKRHALLAGRGRPCLAPFRWGYHFSRVLTGGVSDTYTHLRPMALRDGRLYTWLITLASVLFVLFAGYWNMLGWRF